MTDTMEQIVVALPEIIAGALFGAVIGAVTLGMVAVTFITIMNYRRDRMFDEHNRDRNKRN